MMERVGDFLFFVRPRRFGKSLFVNMLVTYYDVNEKKNFDKYFGDLAIGKAPTANANRYQVLKLNFAEVSPSSDMTLQEAFDSHISIRLDELMLNSGEMFGGGLYDQIHALKAAEKFDAFVNRCKRLSIPIYLVIDEYDNFTNQMLRDYGNQEYRGITHGQGFYRNWFKKFKENCARIFMTGVSPITMDDLTSGFNIAKNISQEEEFNSMLGFNEAECEKLYADFKGAGKFPLDADEKAVVQAFKPWYDGYCFAEESVGKE